MNIILEYIKIYQNYKFIDVRSNITLFNSNLQI